MEDEKIPAEEEEFLSLTKESPSGVEEPEKEPVNPQNRPSEEPKSQEMGQPKGQETANNGMSVKEWLSLIGWNGNPFIFNINPGLLVGYKQQTGRILMALEERHKLMLIMGPTGSGKTTILKWLESRLSDSDVLYIGKPPTQAEEFVKIFNEKYRRPWYAFWKNRLENIYQIPDFLNKKLRKKYVVILMDEAHEASTEVLEWLRVLNDQIQNMSVVLSGLPSFEDQLRGNLETFSKRITAKIELLSLTKEETAELIRKRIQNVGGSGTEMDHIIDSIYQYTGGFPREILRVCDELVNNAIMNGKSRIEFDLHERREERRVETQPAPASLLSRMTPMQKEILEMLSKMPLTPGQIANATDLTKYKTRQHAVRSVNNIVKALYEDGYLERRKEDKAYVYSLAPKISTLFVKR